MLRGDCPRPTLFTCPRIFLPGSIFGTTTFNRTSLEIRRRKTAWRGGPAARNSFLDVDLQLRNYNQARVVETEALAVEQREFSKDTEDIFFDVHEGNELVAYS
jgi:hypothetical protein